jgi:hypothetical protein
VHQLLISALIFITFTSHADEVEVLTVDRVISSKIELAFSNDKGLKAKSSDFKLVNYVTMSNDIGERWAVLTITNTSSGNRMLEQAHLLGLFADGERKAPLELKLNFEGHETQSITVPFGESKFPILSISTEP